jgi:hypothetical protein
MQLVNESSFFADKSLGSTSDLEQVMTVALKMTMTWDDTGKTFCLPKDSWWPLNQGPADYAGVSLSSDFDFRRQHIDLILFGKARAPERRALQRMQVRVSTGAFDRAYSVIGDRRWRQQGKEWVPSEPLAFASMPLSNDRAFGGHHVREQAQCAFPMNPSGKGFTLDDQNLSELELPNIERPDQLVTHWSQTPIPACFHKPAGGLLLNSTGSGSWQELVGSASGAQVDKTLWSKILLRNSVPQSPPDFIVPRGSLGSKMLLAGFSHEGDLRFALPPEQGKTDVTGPVVFVDVGAKRSAFPLKIATILLVVEQRILVVHYSTSFRYGIYPGEERRAALRWFGPTEFSLDSNSADGVAHVR